MIIVYVCACFFPICFLINIVTHNMLDPTHYTICRLYIKVQIQDIQQHSQHNTNTVHNYYSSLIYSRYEHLPIKSVLVVLVIS